jgi:DNA-binding transcriptional regulator YiaG
MTARYEFALKGHRHLQKAYHFKGSGLPNVYLLSGVKIECDPEHGELITVEKLPELFLSIAFTLVAKTEALTGPEIRFLRKRMMLTQTELAKDLRVTEQTVANYEKGKHEPGPADLAVRMLFLAHVVDDEDIANELRLKAEDLMRPSRRDRGQRREAGPWRSAAQ